MRNTIGVENIINDYCVGCEDYKTNNCTKNCIFNRIKLGLRTLEATEETVSSFETSNCTVCRDKKGKNKEIFFDDGRGGLSVADYCPVCGRKIN